MSIQPPDEARRAYALALIRLAAKANAEASRMLEGMTPQPMAWLTEDAVPHAVDARQALHRAQWPGPEDEPMAGQTDLVAVLEGEVEPAPRQTPAQPCACGAHPAPPGIVYTDERGCDHTARLCEAKVDAATVERLDRAQGIVPLVALPTIADAMRPARASDEDPRWRGNRL